MAAVGHDLRFAAIIPAAGSSTRFGAGRNKLLEKLGGVPVIARSVEAFVCRADVCAVVVPAQESEAMARELRRGTGGALDKRVQFCDGGATRAQSVLNGLRALPADIEWVAVHDAARPLASQELIDATLAAAREHGAAVPAMAVQLTIKEAGGPLPARVERTIPRGRLWAMQTPQIMRRAALLEAFERCPWPLDQVTDDVQLLELAGGEVWLVNGEEGNIKITTALDLEVAEVILRGGRSRGGEP